MQKSKTLGNEDFDVWVCEECGTYTPSKKGSEIPECEYCRRLKAIKNET